MKYVVKNLSRRPVSILCNSGKSYHLPPRYAHELAGIEIENNSYIKKLQNRKVIDITAHRENKKEEKPASSSTDAAKKSAGKEDKDATAKAKPVKND